MAISNLQTVNRSLWHSRPRTLQQSRGASMTVAKMNKDLEVLWWVDLGADYPTFPTSQGFTDIAVNGDYVYVTGTEDGDGNAIWCIDQSDGTIAWSAGRNANDSRIPGGILDANWGVEADSNGCYVFSNKYIYHLNTSGTLQWETDLNYSYAYANCTDGTYIYGSVTTSSSTSGIERVNKSGTVVDTWSANRMEDITSDGTYVWGIQPTSLVLFKWTVTGTLQWSKSGSDYSGISPGWAVTNDSGNAYCFATKAGPEYYIIKVDSSGTKQWEYEIPVLFFSGGTSPSGHSHAGDIVTDGSHLFACGASDNSTSDISGTSTLIKVDMSGNYVAHKSGFSTGIPGEHAAVWRRMALEGDYIYLVGTHENRLV